MTVHDDDAAGDGRVPSGGEVPAGLPPTTSLRRVPLATGEGLEIIVIPGEEPADPMGIVPGDGHATLTAILRDWVSAASTASHPLLPSAVVVPLYGCLVVWGPGRAAVVGPISRIDGLMTAVVEFERRASELRDAERRAATLIDAVAIDAARAADADGHSPERRAALAERYREAVAVGRQLALLAPFLHAPPIHPPTLTSQLGERLRDRTRLVERHELAVERAELAERVADSCGLRAHEVATARQQTGLEWTIVVILIFQTVLLVVELLARRGTP